MDKTVISAYINTHLQVPKTLENALQNFEHLNKFFISQKYTLDINIVIELINSNENIFSSLNIIFAKYDKAILMNKTKEIFTNDTLIVFIEAYCIINDIIDNEDDKITLPSHLASYFKELTNYPLLTKEEEYELAYKAKQKDKNARNKLICSNLRLVVSRAKHFFTLCDPMELIQEGNLGLMKAAERFDPSKGYKFSTYAIWWIDQKINNYVTKMQSRINISHTTKANLYRLRQLRNQYMLEHFKEPNFNELLELTKYTPEELVFLLKFEDIKIISTYVDEDEETPVLNTIPSNDNVENEVINTALSSELIQLLAKARLTEREKTVLLLRNGFNNNRIYTQEEISQMLKVSRSRVDQLEKKALKKIRNCSDVLNFAIYMQKPKTAVENLKERR